MSTMPAAPVAVEQFSDLVSLESFVVAGPSRQFDGASTAGIPQLWSRLTGALPFDGQVESWASYGVTSAVDCAKGSFRYLAGVEIRPDAALPTDFETITLPIATYVVFRITLDGGPIHLQMKAAMRTIWDEMVPASGLALAESPDFERYDGRIALTEKGAAVDVYIPVRA